MLGDDLAAVAAVSSLVTWVIGKSGADKGTAGTSAEGRVSAAAGLSETKALLDVESAAFFVVSFFLLSLAFELALLLLEVEALLLREVEEPDELLPELDEELAELRKYTKRHQSF